MSTPPPFPPMPRSTYGGRTHPLWPLVRAGDRAGILALAKDGVDVDVRFMHDGFYTALKRAVGAACLGDRSKIALIETLIEAGARANTFGVVNRLARTSSSGRQTLTVEEHAAFEATFAALRAGGLDVNAVDAEDRIAIA